MRYGIDPIYVNYLYHRMIEKEAINLLRITIDLIKGKSSMARGSKRDFGYDILYGPKGCWCHDVKRQYVSVHRPPHLPCCRALEVQQYVCAPDALHLRYPVNTYNEVVCNALDFVTQ